MAESFCEQACMSERTRHVKMLLECANSNLLINRQKIPEQKSQQDYSIYAILQYGRFRNLNCVIVFIISYEANVYNFCTIKLPLFS